MVFKGIFYELKLNRISYLLEVIETGIFKQKVDAYNKLRKIKLDEESGHLIIDTVMNLKHDKKDNFNADISLLSLLFTNYYDSYFNHLYDAFKTLNNNSKLEFLNILSNSDEPSQIILYRTLVYSYYKELDNYPIGILATKSNNYELLFPELYETFKSNNSRNNILLMLNDFINLGAVPIYHLDKNKKLLQKYIINLFKEGIKYKLDPKDNFMFDKKYIDLRIFLEAAVNIEYYVSNKETKSYLDKLFKTKDNQLKLFILENYSRKDKKLSKININSIAKDNLSRYPLYSFLNYNKNEKLMPKKYANNKELSLSDLYLNYSISVGYSKVPYDFELLEEKVINNYKYYIYKFKTLFNYNEEIDPATDYLLKNIKVDKTLSTNAETTYIGISGGYSIKEDPSLIGKSLEGIKIAKLDGDYESLVNKLLEVELKVKVEDKISKPVKKEKEEEHVEKEPSKLAKIFTFSRILSFFSISIILLFVVLLLFVNNIDLFNLKKNNLNKTEVIKAVLLKPKDLFLEINYNEIFNREENEYYVLFFKKKDKSTYYEYLNTLLKNEYKVYYVDTSKKENKPIFEGNETGFVITGDTLLKVKDHDYSFYVVGKTNVIKEFRSYVDEINKKKEEERKQKEKELEEKKKEEEKKSKKANKKE